MVTLRDPLPEPLAHLVSGWVRTGRLGADVRRFLAHHGCRPTAEHSQAVVAVAEQAARRFGAQVDAVAAAAWLHDVSAVIPRAQRLEAALALGIPVLDEERAVPMILHQKLSAVMAEALFGVHDADVLAAIRYHTTLHPSAGLPAKVVFVADKLAWDQPGRPPYEAALSAALERSPDAAVCVYLDWLWEGRASLPVLHPWMVAARAAFCSGAGGGA